MSTAHHSEEAFRRLVESVEDYAIFMLDSRGVVITWNVGAGRIKGYKAEEIIGEHFSKFYPAQALACGWPAQELEKAAALGRFEDEGWRVRKDGSQFWANVVITALRTDGGDLLGYSKITRDLTTRRENEERLRQSEESLRFLVEGVKDHAMFMLDLDGRVKQWNGGAERVHGHTREDVLGRDCALFLPPEDIVAGKPRLLLAQARRSGYAEDAGWRLRQDGSRFWADVVITALHDGDGEACGFAQITRDLSERRRVQELESEGQRINEFIAMLAHELRNPLAPIGNAVGILEKVGTTPELQWCTKLIGRQLVHLSRLVDDLLDVSRITSGKIQVRREKVDLVSVVTNALDAVQPIIVRCAHSLDVDLPQEPLHMEGDATRLTQVVVNLVTNAAKCTPDGGRVQVHLERLDAHVRLRVVDNGVGMAPALLSRVFDLFVQGDRSLDRSEGGLGIGLTLVKRIVELHDGEISAASEGIGQGTEITVLLPLSPQEKARDLDSQTPLAATEP